MLKLDVARIIQVQFKAKNTSCTGMIISIDGNTHKIPGRKLITNGNQMHAIFRS
jgi:hypothetical protein